MKRRIISVLCMIAILMTCLPMTTKAAEAATWVRKAENEWILQDAATGLHVEAKLMDYVLYIKGTGAIPDNPKDSLGYRPWNGKSIYEIFIEKGITSIGAETFSNLNEVYKVTLPSSLFIESTTAFGGLNRGCHFYFYGTDIVSRNIGNVPYNNIDSMLPTLQKYDHNYFYTFDNYYMVQYINNGISPKISNIAASDCLTQAYNESYPIIDYNTYIMSANSTSEQAQKLTITYRKQGPEALKAFSIMLGENSYAGTYNIYANNGANIRNAFLQAPVQITMAIPAVFQFPGRTFAMVEIIPGGGIRVIQDEDSSDGTFTYTTDYPIGSYMLYYMN